MHVQGNHLVDTKAHSYSSNVKDTNKWDLQKIKINIWRYIKRIKENWIEFCNMSKSNYEKMISDLNRKTWEMRKICNLDLKVFTSRAAVVVLRAPLGLYSIDIEFLYNKTTRWQYDRWWCTIRPRGIEETEQKGSLWGTLFSITLVLK